MLMVAAVKRPLGFSSFQVETQQFIAKVDRISVLAEAKDIGCHTAFGNVVFPPQDPGGAVEGVHVPALSIAPDHDEIAGDQGIAMKGESFSILQSVILPFDLSSFLVECAGLAVAGTHKKQVAHDRGGGESSAGAGKLPGNPGIRGGGRRRCRQVPEKSGECGTEQKGQTRPTHQNLLPTGLPV